MKKRILTGLSLGFFVSLFSFSMESNAAIMQRMYNRNSGEHFYTSSLSERNSLLNSGWLHEGISWVGPNSGTSVYRLYNPNAGDHHYTTSTGERDNLARQGWRNEGLSWHSANSGIPVYRLYNPNAKGAGAHHYTLDAGERDTLKRAGWRDEGIGWYATSKTAQTNDKTTDLYKRVHSFEKWYWGTTTPISYIGSGARSGATQYVFTTQPNGKPISHAPMVINVENGAMWGVGMRDYINNW